MELTYQNQMLLPASYTVLSEEEMTYIEGGAITASDATAAVLNFAINFAVNTIKTLGQGAFNAAWNGMKEMHDDGLSITGSVKHYWGRQTPAGKAGTVVVGVLPLSMFMHRPCRSSTRPLQIYKDIKAIYEQTKADRLPKRLPLLPSRTTRWPWPEACPDVI